MIKFYGDNLLKHSKIIENTIERGNNIYEALHFDLKNKYIFVLNDEKILRLKFDYTLEDESQEIPNFYISAHKFLHILKKNPILVMEIQDKDTAINITSDEIAFSKCLNIKTEKEVIKIGLEYDDGDIETYNETFENGEYDNTEIEINEEFNNDIRNSLSFIDKSPDSALHGVFIRNSTIISTNISELLYEKKIKDLNLPDMTFTVELVKIINSLKSSKLKLLKNDSTMILSDEDNNIAIKISNIFNLNLDLDTNTKDFIDNYDFKSSFEINKNIFKSCLEFLDFFVQDCPDSRINIKILKDKLLIKVIDNNYVEKYVDLIQVSEELIGYDFWVVQDTLKTVIKNLKTENVIFQIEPKLSDESPIINSKNKDIDDIHIIFVKYCENL